MSSAGEPWGLLALDKPPGITSHAATQRVRRALRASRAGHAGTLDPLASGLLLVGLGRGTRLLEYVAGHDKVYRARVRLGEVRDTLDREGRIVDQRPVPALARGRVEEALARFVGTIEQTPPAYAAIKEAGVPLYRKARRGEKVEPPPRRVTIHSAELVELSLPDLVVVVKCSKGTYVRSFARDLGEVLGTGATLWELLRTRSGPFRLETAVSLARIEALGRAAWSEVLPPERMVGDLPRVVLDDGRARDLSAGREVSAGQGISPGPLAVFRQTGELVAVAQGESGRLRPRKVLWQPL